MDRFYPGATEADLAEATFRLFLPDVEHPAQEQAAVTGTELRVDAGYTVR